MRDPFQWSISLGRWWKPTVRLHVFFLVFAAATFFLCWQDPAHGVAGNLVGLATAAMFVLFASVLIHEWSHWLVADYVATAPDTIVVGPLGGLSDFPLGWEPRKELICMLAGPAVNLVICLGCVVSLYALGAENRGLQLLNPLAPVWIERGVSLTQQGLQLTLWVNWLLFLTNLLPAFPFDGGRILRAALNVTRPDWEQRRISDVIFWLAVGLSSAIMMVAIVLLKYPSDTIFPMSFALLLMGVVLLVSARRDVSCRADLAPQGAHDTELEAPWPFNAESDEWEECDECDESEEESESSEEGGFWDPESEENDADDEQWQTGSTSPTRAPDRQEIEAEEERMVDEILSRLHSLGIDSLAPEERALLERVSARYRNRLGRHI